MVIHNAYNQDAYEERVGSLTYSVMPAWYLKKLYAQVLQICYLCQAKPTLNRRRAQDIKSCATEESVSGFNRL